MLFPAKVYQGIHTAVLILESSFDIFFYRIADIFQALVQY